MIHWFRFSNHFLLKINLKLGFANMSVKKLSVPSIWYTHSFKYSFGEALMKLLQNGYWKSPVPREAIIAPRSRYHCGRSGLGFARGHTGIRTNPPFTILAEFALFRRPINVMDRFARRYVADLAEWPLIHYIGRARRGDTSERHLGMPRSVFLVKWSVQIRLE